MYSDVMVKAMVLERVRERNQHEAEGRTLRAMATPARAARPARPLLPKITLGPWFAWLKREPRRAAAAAA